MKHMIARGTIAATLFLWALFASGCSVRVGNEEGDVTSTQPASIVTQATATATSAQTQVTVDSPSATSMTATATPQATTTAVPSPTVARTPEGVEHIAPGALPVIQYDVLFLDGRSLKVWRGESGLIETLASPVLEYEVATGGESVLILRSGANSAAWELALIDLNNGQEQLLASGRQELADFALAPDAIRLAYIIGQREPQTAELRPAETIFVLDSALSSTASVAGVCDTIIDIGERRLRYYLPCGPLVWAPDSQSILWGDGTGVWRSAPDGDPLLLTPNEIFEDDAPRLFKPTDAWSPNGRHLLLAAHRGEGSELVVYDTETQQVVEVPHSVSGLGEVAHWMWTAEGSLFTVRHREWLSDETDPAAELWQLAGQSLTLGAATALPGGEEGYPAAPAQFADGRFGFALNGNVPPQDHGLYLLPSLAQPAQMVARLPQVEDSLTLYGQSVFWAPDGSGAIVVQIDPGTEAILYVLYVSAAEGALYEVRPALGQNPHSFHWLPLHSLGN